jgi:hypothetical protein
LANHPTWPKSAAARRGDYFLPFRYADFSDKLERSGLQLLTETIAPRQSIAELYAQRTVRQFKV